MGQEITTNVAAGAVISATATRLDASLNPVETSEFAANITTVNQALVVTNTTDTINGDTTSVATLIATPGGDGISLREAITAANNTTGVDLILFNIAGVGTHTITLGSALPTIGGTLIIDGYTQGGSSQNTLSVGTNAVLNIELNGNSLSASGLRLGTGSDGSTISGLSIVNFDGNSTSYGIRVDSNNNIIAGNYIGLRADGDGSWQ